MANRKNTFLLKRSNVAGNIPVAGQILLGELALNTADVILYASGTTSDSILPIGWDRIARTGDTMTGTLYVPTLSATTYQNLPPSISADTYWISGSSGNYSVKANNDSSIDATGDYSHAEGNSTTANGFSSHAEGETTTAFGDYSHAEGFLSIASGSTSHAEGDSTIAGGLTSHAEGAGSIASGDYSHAEGNGTTASGTNSHAEGYGTTASTDNSHAEGYLTKSLGVTSHAEGERTTASGNYSHAEGNLTKAIGHSSHSQGEQTTASGQYSHAGGTLSIASGLTSFVHGTSSIAGGANTIVLGNNITGLTANTTYVNKLNIKSIGSGIPLINLGLDSSGNVITGTTGGGSFTGGTVTGATNFTNGLTANTISATTYQGLPIYPTVTGFTYNNTNQFTIQNSTGGTLNASINTVTGLTVSGVLSATTISSTTLNINGAFKYVDENQGLNKILTSDLDGNATWQPPSVVGNYVLFFKNSASDIATYLQAVPEIQTGPLQTITNLNVTANTVLATFVSASGGTGLSFFPAGIVTMHIHAANTNSGKQTQLYFKIYKRTSGGTETLLGTSSNSSLLAGVQAEYSTDLSISATTANTSDRIVTKVYAYVVGGGTEPNINLYLEDSTLSRVQFPSTVVNSTNYVPYSGANSNLNLGVYSLIANTVSATTFYGDGSNLTGIARTTFTGTTILDFGFSGGSEGDLATSIIVNPNIISTSFVMYNIIPSIDHETTVDALLDGIIINTSDIVDGYGFTINAISSNNTWGRYNVNYKIIN